MRRYGVLSFVIIAMIAFAGGPLEAQALSDALPRGSLAVLDSGHFPYIEDPGGLTSAVASFLGALTR